MSTSRNDEVDLLAQLWRECAGPTAKVPRVDDKVFYFPQGHLHQVEAYMKQEGMSNNIPSYGLPSKILCKVVRVDLKAEVGTDEVFAEITLLPNCSEGEGPKLTSVVSEKKPATFFRKRLTPSDVIKQGGCSLHKRHVDQTFPALDMKQDAPYQDLIAKDLHGQIWKFRHICRGLPKRHILTTGWSKFVSEKRLLPSDICIFLRGKNQLYVGVQRAVRGHKLPTELSTNNMKHGILLTAFEAFKTRTEFTVYYHPRISPSGFVVTYDDFMESLEANFSPKSRVEMVLDGGGGGGEEPELNLKKFSGFITGKEDVDPTMWPHSEWQSLKVCWDATSLGNVLPKRVSPWSIRSLESPLPHQQSLAQKLTLPKVNFSNPSLKNENKKCTLFGVEIGYTNTNSSNQQSNVTTPNYIKVLKHGGILGRFIDVTRVSGYKGLVSELDDMFDFQGMLANGNTQWHVTYEALGDCNKKILGNLPWLEFRKVVRKMYICQKEEVPKWNHS